MRRKTTEPTETRHDETALPTGVVLKPPVSADDLKTDIEDDPEGAEEFVALIRALRKEGSRSPSDERHNGYCCGHRRHFILIQKPPFGPGVSSHSRWKTACCFTD
jgi:hypothetical protein